MKVIVNNFIPFKGFKAINLFGVVFVRNNSVFSETDYNHEAIHTEQMKELAYIFFYLWYVIEWIVRIFVDGYSKAYRRISFEQEAYDNQHDLDYTKNRKLYSWIDYYKNNG